MTSSSSTSSLSSSTAYTRPISVMSLLADQMECSTLTEDKTEKVDISLKRSCKNDTYDKLTDHTNLERRCKFIACLSSHRHSFSFGCCKLINDLILNPKCVLWPESSTSFSNYELPSKRKCHSVSSSTNDDHITRPIPIKICVDSQQQNQNANVVKSLYENSCRLNRVHHHHHHHHHLHNHKSGDCSSNKFQPISRLSYIGNKTVLICQNQRNHSNNNQNHNSNNNHICGGTSSNRPIIFAHKKSAFISTRSVTSPHTSSSDYSISPDIDSPVHRPDSVTSSGFHDCSQQSLLIDPNYSPDSNQCSGCSATVAVTNDNVASKQLSDPLAAVILPRCHSQPCYEPVSRNININHSILRRTTKPFTCQNDFNNINDKTNSLSSQFHVSLKRRYPSLTQILPVHINHDHSNSDTVDQSETQSNRLKNSINMECCYKYVTCSADTSPSAYGVPYTKRDGYFFSNSRNYLVSLPRIASSPTPVSPQSNSNCQKDEIKEIDQPDNLNHRQRIGSNSSSLSTSTTTDMTTPTIISNTNSVMYMKRSAMFDNAMSTNKENLEDVEMIDNNDFQIEKRSNAKIKQLDYLPHSLSTSDGNLFDMSLETDQNQLQFWQDQSFIQSRHSVNSSCSVSVASNMTTKSYSTNSDDTSSGGAVSGGGDRGGSHNHNRSRCTNASNNSSVIENCASSRSEYRDPDDPPEIVGESVGFCFRQLINSDLMNYNNNNSNDSSSFQELDLDQIELD